MEQRASHFTFKGIGVRFEFWFWLIVVWYGVRMDDIRQAALWVALVTVSILIHEFGHAFAYKFYGAEARISMHGMGGLTHGTGTGHLTSKQRIVVSLAGSVTEMVVLGAPAWLLQQTWNPGGWAGLTLHWLVWINVVWALVNLAPVWPMDGGQIMNELLYMKSGRSRRRLTHRISIVTGIGAAVLCWTNGFRWGIFLFGFFVIINVFAAGIVKTKRPYTLWPGVTTHGRWDTADDTARPRKAKSKEWVAQGYASLAIDSTTSARNEARHAKKLAKSKKDQQRIGEMLTWAALAQRKTVEAKEQFANTRKPSKSLQAAMVLERGSDEEGIELLAAAVMSEAQHPASEQGILYAARSGHIRLLVERLLDDGHAGLGHAVRVQQVLERADVPAARLVAELI